MSFENRLSRILWEVYEDGCRRCEADLWRFVGPLYEWIEELLQQVLPADWRDRLGAYLDSWEPEGFEVEPDQRRILEDWVEDVAEFRGLDCIVSANVNTEESSGAAQEINSFNSAKAHPNALLSQPDTRSNIAAPATSDSGHSRFVLAAAQLAQPLSSSQLAPVTIYIDLTTGNQQGRPNSISAQTLPQIQKEMNDAVANAGIGLTVTLVPTAPPTNTTLGFEMKGIIGFRTMKAYNHEVAFKVGQGGVGLAMTGGPGHTVIIGNKLESRFPRITPTQWANILLHEVIYLGLGIGNDDNTGPAIKRSAPGRALVDLSPIKNEINNKLKK